MNYIAVTGPMFSGKTTLARELERRGYMFIDFTGLLKELAAQSLSAVGHFITPDRVRDEKNTYRAYLQEFGNIINFSNEPYFVATALTKWYAAGRPSAVFDNVRTDSQARFLKSQGFQIVELCVSELIQFRRADNLGITLDGLQTMQRHSIESGIDEDLVDLCVNADLSTKEYADLLIKYSISEAA